MSLTLVLICLCVVALMVVAQRGKQNYSCVQCGSKNGKHAKHCSFYKLDDD